MDVLQHFLSRAHFTARYLFSDRICGLSPTHYAGCVGYLHYFREGKLTVLCEGSDAFTLTEPTLVFFPGILPHHLHGDEAVGARMLCCVVDSDTGMRRAVSAVVPNMLVIPVAEVPSLHATLGLLMAEADSKGQSWQLACERLFEYLIAQILRWAVETGRIDTAALAGFGDPKLARSLAALHDGLAHDWSLDSLAAYAGMSRSSYAIRFAAVMGVTPAEYVLSIRLIAAKNLLKRGESVKSVAAQTGFSAASVFTRAFVRKTGLSPLEWLAQFEAQA